MTSGSQSTPLIVMYARERFCPDVQRARRRLTELGLNWAEFDVEADAAANDRMLAISGSRKVPTMVIGETILVEPSVEEIDSALEAAGITPVNA